MMQDAELYLNWVRVCLLVAGVCTTTFPIVYAFAPWWTTWAGKALMVQGVAFALAVDLTLLFTYWAPENLLTLLLINVFVFTLVAGASLWLTWRMVKLNPYIFRRRKKKASQNV